MYNVINYRRHLLGSGKSRRVDMSYDDVRCEADVVVCVLDLRIEDEFISVIHVSYKHIDLKLDFLLLTAAPQLYLFAIRRELLAAR